MSGAEQEAAYLRQVEAMEVAGGPYAGGLSEPLEGLARLYREAGDARSATALYQRALHILRVNDGLYSARQVPLVRALLDITREGGDLEQLDQRYDYFYRLYGSGQPPFTDIRLRAAVEYLRWQREAVRRDLDENDKRRLLDLYYLNERLLESVAEHGPVGYRWHRELVLSQLRNLYLVQARVAPRLHEVGLVHYNPLPGPGPSGPGDQDFDSQRLESIQRGALSRGRELLEQLLALSMSEGPVAQSAAQLELGDWYQWNGVQGRAADHYALAAAGLSAAGEPDLLASWLGEPRELPDNGAYWQPPLPGADARPGPLRARYDVSARGRASNVTTEARRAQDAPAAGQLRRELSRTRFRPRFVDGRPVATSGVVAQYDWYD